MLSTTDGTRAPHLWIERAGQRLSTLDLLGQRFVLLAGPAGAPWLSAARTVAARLGLDLDLYRAETDFNAVDGAFCAAYGITPRGAVLVRPDGFVGLRSTQDNERPAETLMRVCAQLLQRV